MTYLAEPLERRMLLAAVNWTGGGGNNFWMTPANWSSNPNLPGANDDVTIDVAGTPLIQLTPADYAEIKSLHIVQPLSFGNINVHVLQHLTLDVDMSLAGSIITGLQGITLNAVATLGNSALRTNGLLDGNGTVLFNFFGGSSIPEVGNFGAAMSIASSITIHGNTGTVGRSGQLTENYGNIVSDGGGTIELRGTGFVNRNTGDLTANSGSTLTISGTPWTNEGTISINGGTLNLGGSFTTAGLGNLINNGGTINLIGVLDNSSSTLTLNNAIGSWTLDGGTISGGTVNFTDNKTLFFTNNLNNLLIDTAVTSELQQIAGYLRIAGTTSSPIFHVIGTLAITPGYTLSSHIIIDPGFGAHSISMVGSGTFTIAASAVLDVNAAYNGVALLGSGGMTLVNHGIVSSSGGPSSEMIVQVANLTTDGQLIASRKLTINGVVTCTGGGITGPADVTFAGTFNWTAGDLSGPGTMIIPSGTTLNITGGAKSSSRQIDLSGNLTGDSNLTINGIMNWLGGTMSGTGKAIIDSGATLNINTTAAKTLSRTLENNGTVIWTNGKISYSGGTFENKNVVNDSTNLPDPFVTMFNAGGTNLFRNSGAFNRLTGGGSFIQVPFDNTSAGTVTANSQIRLYGGGTSSGSFVCAAGGAIGIGFPGYQFDNTSTISGPGTLTFDASTGVLVQASISGLGEMRVTSSPSTVVTFTKPISMAATGNIQARDGATGIFNGPVTSDQVYSYGAGKLVFNGNVTATYGIRPVDPGGEVQLNGALSTISLLGLDTATQVSVGTGGNKLVVAYRVELNGTAKLDLADNAMVVDYTSPNPSPLLSIKSLLTTGYAGGAWNGVGINSSAAAANLGHALGYGEASDLLGITGNQTALFAGQTVDASSVLIRYTRYGDANLDQMVNLSDFNRLAGSFGTGNLWSQGNFNFDSAVNLNDFNLLAGNFGLPVAPSARVTASPFAIGKTIRDALLEEILN